jgi:RNA 2',3'-cyclic 3'-phosphodiesterase
MMPCQPVHRLFYALRPPPAAAAFIRADCAWLGRGKWIREEHFHVTLNILDDWPFQPRELLAAMIAVGDAVAAPSFRIVLDQLSGSRRSIVLRPSEPIARLHEFQQSLANGLGRAGVATRRDVRFSPHLTLVHPGRPDFVASADPVSWPVEEFFLIESLVGWTRHVVHKSWRLGSAR